MTFHDINFHDDKSDFASQVRILAEADIRSEEFQHAVEKEKARLRRRARLKRLVLSLLKPWRSL